MPFVYLLPMKNIIPLIAIILFLASCHRNNIDESESIKSVLTAQSTAWNDGNIDAYMQGYWNDDSLLFIGKGGPGYGYMPTLERYKKSYPDKEAMGELSFSGLSFRRLSDEYYYVTGRWSLVRVADNPNGYFTLLFRKINDKWVIIADHSS